MSYIGLFLLFSYQLIHESPMRTLWLTH